MPDSLIPYAKVRVLQPPKFGIDIFVRSSKRCPRIGDEAVITFINRYNSSDRIIGAECYDAQGELEWISMFTADELELLEPAGPQQIFAPLTAPEIASETPQLFVWREWQKEWYQSRDQWLKGLNCIYCNASLTMTDSDVCPSDQDTRIDTKYYREATCSLCGWAKRRWISYHTEMPGINSGRWATFRQIRSFEISDPQIALHELASHLKRQYTDIHSITPRRFEELIAEIFRGLGWDASLTLQLHFSFHMHLLGPELVPPAPERPGHDVIRRDWPLRQPGSHSPDFPHGPADQFGCVRAISLWMVFGGAGVLA